MFLFRFFRVRISRRRRKTISHTPAATLTFFFFPLKKKKKKLPSQVLRPRAQRPLLRQRPQLPLDRRPVANDLHPRRDRRRRRPDRGVAVTGGGRGGDGGDRRRPAREPAPRPRGARPLRGLCSLPDGRPEPLRDRGSELARRVGGEVVLGDGPGDAAQLARGELKLAQLVRQQQQRREGRRRCRRCEADGPARVRGGPACVRAGRRARGAAGGEPGKASENCVLAYLVRKEGGERRVER